MNMKKLAIITFATVVLLVPGNTGMPLTRTAPRSQTSRALLPHPSVSFTDSSNIRAWTSPILKAHSFMRRLPET